MNNCKKLMFTLLATLIFLCVPMTTNASTVDITGLEADLASYVASKTPDRIVDKAIDDFNGDGKVEAIVATSPQEGDCDLGEYSIWYVSDGTISEFDVEHFSSFMWLTSYTIGGQKLFAVCFFENHITTWDYVYYMDDNGFHYLGTYPTTYESGGYLGSSQGLMGLEGWYTEDEFYKFENNKLIPVDGPSQDTATSQGATNPITNPEWYHDYDYSLNPSNKTLILDKYHGQNDHVYVKDAATIDGIRYDISIDGILFKGNTTVKAVSFAQGCKVYGTNLSFEDAEALEYVNFYGLDTSDVESFRFMFANCSNLREVRLGGLDTSKVTTVAWMFLNCSSLKKLDLSNLDFSNVIKAENMLLRCGLEELMTPSTLSTAIKLPYFFGTDNNNDGIVDDDEDYKILTAGTEQSHFILKNPAAGTDYYYGLCHIVKEGDDYYLYPYMNESYMSSVDNEDFHEVKDGIKIAKDAMVGISNIMDVFYGEDDYICVDYNPEYYPFYEKVDELFESKHWSEEPYGDSTVLSFYTVDEEGRYITNMPLIAMNEGGEIVLISDHFSE